MDVFALRDRLIDDYADYVRSFIEIHDPRIGAEVERELDGGRLWPSEGDPARCDYCGGRRRTVPLASLADWIDEPYRTYYEPGDEHPVFDTDSDSPRYEQAGEDPVDVLQEEAEIDFEIARDVVELLADRESVDVQDGADAYFDTMCCYVRRDLHPYEYIEEWRSFSEGIKHARRFFDDEARQRLASILGSPGSSESSELPVLEIGPTDQRAKIFRARIVNFNAEARRFLSAPAVELGAPPVEKAAPGRMNPAGISVFYGAFSEDTAIAEVRPSVGGLVVVATFHAMRKLRLLDLTRLGSGFIGSIFRPGYEQRRARLRFLEGFHELIARPIQPHEQAIEYIPTQAVAEYLAHVLGFDGIVYASSQVGAICGDGRLDSSEWIEDPAGRDLQGHNVALFGDAARIEGDRGLDSKSGHDSCAPPAAAGHGASQAGSLCYVEGNARVVRVLSVRYQHQPCFFSGEEGDEPF